MPIDLAHGMSLTAGVGAGCAVSKRIAPSPSLVVLFSHTKKISVVIHHLEDFVSGGIRDSTDQEFTVYAIETRGSCLLKPLQLSNIVPTLRVERIHLGALILRR